MSKAEWPAFPAMHYDLAEHEHGLTLRDYFAAKAMQAIISKAEYVVDKADTLREYKNQIARGAYSYADAMMEARK